MRRLAKSIAPLALLVLVVGCQHHSPSGFLLFSADRHVSSSAYPVAIEPARVGTYQLETQSGAGYFYDDVLEYRVWMHPERGALPMNGKKDYMAAFATYEAAEAFSKQAAGAEQPLVLVRQREWINEPEPGKYVAEKGERLSEWRVQWLRDSKRYPNSIEEFLKHPKPDTTNDENE